MTLKTALVAPTPSARDSTAVRVNPGRRRNSRAAYCKSDASECICNAIDARSPGRLGQRWRRPGGLSYTRNASSGEIELARSAGIKDAANAEDPSVTTAASVTTGLYGFMP